MNDKSGQPTDRFGLLASGFTSRWHISVDEALDRDEWSVEIDGPQTYLVFQLQDLRVIPAALRFLEEGPRAKQRPDAGQELPLGRFGAAAVSLLWDNEDFPRCFLLVGPEAGSTLRVSLAGDEIPVFIEALRQVVKDLPPDQLHP